MTDGDRTGRVGQVGIYLKRLFRIFIHEKDWKVLPMAGLIAFIVAYVVGTNMFVNMEGTLIGALAFVCVCIWNGLFNSIQVVCRERDIIKREHRTGMHISSYIVAHMIYQAFLCVMQVIISLMVYRLMGVHFLQSGAITGNFVMDMGITLFLITYASDMLALMCSCIVQTTTMAMTVMPFVLIIQLVFSGVAFPLRGSPAKIANGTISKWGIYAVCSESDYNSLPSTALYSAIRKFSAMPGIKEISQAIQKNNMQAQLGVLAGKYLQVPAYSFSGRTVLKDWLILVLFSLLYAAIGTIALEFIDHDKR